MPRIDTEVKRWVSGGNASPPERTKSPGKHAWRGVSRKYCTNKGGEEGKEGCDHLQRGRLEPAGAVDKV